MSDLLQWLNLHPQLAGLVTFIISAAESIAIIGTIIPGSVTMTAIGALAGAGVIPLYGTLIWAILGAIVGDSVSYWIGRYFNDRLPNLWPFRTRPGILATGESFFHKHGGKSVFIGRFVGPVRALVPLVAGMLGMKPLRFTIANVLSAIGWAPAYMLPGILLGRASLELPPDIAVHAMLMLVLIGLLIIFCIWVIQKILKLISDRISESLTRLWNHLKGSRYFKLITILLKHHNPKKTHGQLILAFYFIITLSTLVYLSHYVFLHSSQSIIINNIFFHLSRSIRTPLGDNIMLFFTFMGDKTILLPITLILCSWLIWKKYFRTGLHFLALIILTVLGSELLKQTVHSLRPWGVFQNPDSFSFPSGHTALATAFYMGITLILMQIYQLKTQRVLYISVITLIVTVGLSRIYLGAHWFTDVLSGWLLGSAALMLVLLSYNRQREKKSFHSNGFLLVFLLSFLLVYSSITAYSFETIKKGQTEIDWPTYTTTERAWWMQVDKHLPLYRINRFGLSQQVLNIQWLGELNQIQSALLEEGWRVPPKRDWINILHRIGDIESTQHLPLVSPLYLDKKPVLILIKYQRSKKLIVLRLWRANLIINDKIPLWVGSVEVIPRTYSWLFKKKKQLILTPALLFNQTPADYVIKEFQVKHKSNAETLSMLLIKPKM